MEYARRLSIAIVLGAVLLLANIEHSIATDRRSGKKLTIGDASRSLEAYAQINRGVLSYDDGRERRAYFVDNGYSSSRFGLIATANFDRGLELTGQYEAEYDPYSTLYVNQLNRGTVDWSDAYKLRILELGIFDPKRGKLKLGQGHMVSDGVAERDLSGTKVISYSPVFGLAGAQYLQFSDELGLSDISISDVFGNLDGLGRKLRVRYETPRIHGFAAASSVGREVVTKNSDTTVWDIRLDYKNDLGSYKLDGGIAFSKPDSDQNLISGSISSLHMPSGISFTAAAGIEDLGSINQKYVYGKIGYQTQYFDFGATLFSADAYAGENFESDGSESYSVGFQSVQKIDRIRTELYIGVRYYRYNDLSANYKSSSGILTGARVKF